VNEQEISNQRRKLLAEICQRYGLAILYVFGSRAQEVYQWSRGALSELPASVSDVDIGIKPHQQVFLSFDKKAQIAMELEELFKVPRVDLVSLFDAKPFLALDIIRGERLYARDENIADEYDLFILRQAGDLVPLERERIDLILRKTR
jgi:predicted nucleotidyltransferase